MKYFESDTDYSSRSLASPLDLLRFVITCIFLSPIRLILEISKKVLFTGEYFKKFIMNCIYINVALIILSVLSSIFVTKRFYLFGNLIPLPSLVISLLLVVGFYYFESNKHLEVDFELKDSIEDNINKIADVYGADFEDLSTPIKEEVKPVNSLNNIENLSDEEEFEINSDEDFDKVYDSVVEEVMPTTDPSKRKEISAKLEEYKKKMKENAQLHESSTCVKQNFMDVKDQEQAKLDLIRSAAMDSDESSEFSESIGNLTSLLRNDPRLGPSVKEIDIETSDDSPIIVGDKSLHEYNKEINNRVKKRSASLDSFMSSSNSAKMVEVEDEFVNEYSTSNDDPSTSIADNFLSHLESSDSSMDSINDFGIDYGADFYGDMMNNYGMGVDYSHDGGDYIDPSYL